MRTIGDNPSEGREWGWDPDYVIYNCMFGCSEPFAFVGIGTLPMGQSVHVAQRPIHKSIFAR
jgi:hypothetical protein